MNYIKLIVITMCVFISVNGNATTFDGAVISVHDGDTISVMNESGTKEIVRLFRADAPEMQYKLPAQPMVPTQPYAVESKDALIKLCPIGSIANVTRKGAVSYSRSVAVVTCNGVNVADNMIQTGNAWVYRYTSTIAYRKMQSNAQDKKLGLWAAPAVEPYLWRRGIR